MNFKLSPSQYNRMPQRDRMRLALAGFSASPGGVQARFDVGASGQVVPDARFKAMAVSTLQAPVVGSGLTPGYRAALRPSTDTVDLQQGSITNLPGYTRAPGSNRTGRSEVKRFDSRPTMDPSQPKVTLPPAPRLTPGSKLPLLNRNPPSISADKASPATVQRDETPRIDPSKVELKDDIKPQLTLEAETAQAMAEEKKSNTLLYVGAAALGLGVLYFITRK